MKKSLIYSLMAIVSAGIVARNVSLAEDGITYNTGANITYTDTNGKVFTGIGTITITSGDESITILDRNLGATMTGYGKDAPEDSYGYYFQRGNNYGFTSKGNVKTGDNQIDVNKYSWKNPYSGDVFIINDTTWFQSSNDDLWGDRTETLIARQGPCPIGYHVPTHLEWQNLYDYAVNYKKAQNIDKASGAIFSELFRLPLAGYRGRKDGNVGSQNGHGNYWSSVMNSGVPYSLVFNLSTVTPKSPTNGYTPSGFSVRCFANPTYTVLFETNGGTDVKSLTGLEGTKINAPEIPMRTGYSFSGWYLSGADVEWNFSTDIITGDITLYAKWNKILTLHATGAVIPESEGWTNSENNQVATGIVEEKYGELPTPIQTGYHFEGWSRLPDGYQEVEYIESHGTEYIDLGIVANTVSRFQVQAQGFEYEDGFNKQLIGTNGSERNTFFGWRKVGKAYSWYGTNKKLEGSILGLADYIYAGNNVSGNVNGYAGEEEIIFDDKSLFLLGGYKDTKTNRVIDKSDIYYLKLRVDYNLKFYGIPCVTSGGEYGLYDLVSNQFFGNSGDGAFSGGDIVYIKSGNTVEENTFDLYAKWSPMYYIQFMSGNNVLQSGYVAPGDKPVYTGNTGDLTYVNSGYVYVFSGWNPEIVAATKDTDYTAVFSGILIPMCDVEYSPNITTSGNVEATLTGCNQEGVTIQSIDEVDLAELKDGKVIFSGNGSLTGIIENTAGITGEVLFKVSRIDRSQPAPTPEEPESTVSGRSGGGGHRHISNEKSDLDGEVEVVVDKSLYDSKYSDEMNEAYLFAYENGITTMNPISKADMNGGLTRIAMAKMLSQYAINILGKAPANLIVPKFVDVTEEMNENYGYGVSLAYQLGIMGINMLENKFRPNDKVTRGEFGTALSRMIYGISDGEEEYYSTHLDKLYEEGVISNKDAKLEELRGYVMLMLMRSAK